MRVVRPGEGPLLCSHEPGCGNLEIDGMGFCLQHMPDDMLDEAERITGLRRCRMHFGEPGACHQYAVEGSNPPRCKNHGASVGMARSKMASGNVVEGRVQDRMIEIMRDQGERLLNPPPVDNPLTALLDLASEMAEWKRIMQEIVAYLLSKDRVRYAHDRVGEQLRAEVLIYERAIERLAKLYMGIIKLGIEARLKTIEAEQIRTIEQALDAVLARRGLGLVEQEEARQELARELSRAS